MYDPVVRLEVYFRHRTEKKVDNGESGESSGFASLRCTVMICNVTDLAQEVTMGEVNLNQIRRGNRYDDLLIRVRWPWLRSGHVVRRPQPRCQ
jgi:hypothetical protein